MGLALEKIYIEGKREEFFVRMNPINIRTFKYQNYCCEMLSKEIAQQRTWIYFKASTFKYTVHFILECCYMQQDTFFLVIETLENFFHD